MSEKKPKAITYPTIHVDLRHGTEWPRKPGQVYRWTGWLTHREYNLIEGQLRFGHHDMYHVGDNMGLKSNSIDRMYYSMINSGVITGEVDNFTVTPMAKILFDMTDQYILQLDLSHEEDVA